MKVHEDEDENQENSNPNRGMKGFNEEVKLRNRVVFLESKILSFKKAIGIYKSN